MSKNTGDRKEIKVINKDRSALFPLRCWTSAAILKFSRDKAVTTDCGRVFHKFV